LIVPYSLFYIAAGAVIIDNDRILLVQEKSVLSFRFRDNVKDSLEYLEEEQILEKV
jgi:hypothetical protein